MIFVIIGYFIGSRYNLPVCVISIFGAIVLLSFGSKEKSISWADILKRSPWSIILFAFGMYVIVYSLYKNGLNDIMLFVLYIIKGKGKIFTTIFSGLLTTITACTMNNLPSVMVGAFSVKFINLNGAYKEIISFASIIGNDIGAKLTPIGSLATILWINILKSKGINISWREYMISASFIILPVLILTLITLGLII